MLPPMLPDYYLLEDAEGFELTGEALPIELRYPATRAGLAAAKRVVHALTLIVGARLHRYAQGGAFIETKFYPARVDPMKN